MITGSIEWHKECLKNSKGTAERMRIQLAEMEKRYCDLNSSNTLYEWQIECAEKACKAKFDRDRYKKQGRIEG